ncbi:hypothetical protein Hanom_Chr06g00551631 [Helianthus anomalus]
MYHLMLHPPKSQPNRVLSPPLLVLPNVCTDFRHLSFFWHKFRLHTNLIAFQQHSGRITGQTVSTRGYSWHLDCNINRWEIMN